MHSDQIFDYTPRSFGGERYREISLYLDREDFISRYVILDDVTAASDDDPRFIRTDPNVGLTEADVDRAVSILKALS